MAPRPRMVQAIVAVGAWLALSARTAMAASPTPTVPTGADTRSPLEGPGFVGAPGLAILLVMLIAVGTILATLVYIRVTGDPGRARPPGPPEDGDARRR